MKKLSLKKTIDMLKFDEAVTKVTYPKKARSITFDSDLETKLMEDAGGNSRLVGTIVRAIVRGYYSGNLGGSGGRSSGNVAQQIVKARYDTSEEGKKVNKQRKNLIGELSREIQSKRIEAEPVVYDLSRYDVLDQDVAELATPELKGDPTIKPPPVPKT